MEFMIVVNDGVADARLAAEVQELLVASRHAEGVVSAELGSALSHSDNGSKSSLRDWTTLFVEVSGSLTALIAATQAWCDSRKRKVRLKVGDDEIELDNASDAEQRALVQAWVRAQNQR